MQYKILNNYIWLKGDAEKLKEIRERYSFNDKSAESQIRRLINSCSYRETLFPKTDEGLTIFPDWYLPWKSQKLGELKEKRIRSACKWTDDGDLMVPIGLLFEPEMQGILLRAQGIDTRNFDQNTRKFTGPYPNLRRPQEEALNIVKGSITRMGLIRMATGVGKTTLGQEIIRHFGHKSLFVVPSERIFSQTIERFEKYFGKKNVGAFGDGKKRHSHVTVAIYQSLFKADPDDLKDYNLAIFDEVHHIGAETFYEVGLNRMPNLIYRFGMTADEERSDGGTVLVNAAAGPVIYDYPASQGIADKLLARPTFVMYGVTKTEGSYTEWKTDYKTNERKKVGMAKSEPIDGDDHHLAYKNWVLGNDILTETVAALTRQFNERGKNVLILVDEKEHGEKFLPLLPGCGYMYGGNSDNDDIQSDFNARKLKTIVATSVVGEGTDTITVDVLINLMGGRRPKQANGRALRNDPDPETGIPRKPTTTIIDFYFPHSPVLNRHAEEREVVHRSYVGEIHQKGILI